MAAQRPAPSARPAPGAREDTHQTRHHRSPGRGLGCRVVSPLTLETLRRGKDRPWGRSPSQLSGKGREKTHEVFGPAALGLLCRTTADA